MLKIQRKPEILVGKIFGRVLTVSPPKLWVSNNVYDKYGQEFPQICINKIRQEKLAARP